MQYFRLSEISFVLLSMGFPLAAASVLGFVLITAEKLVSV